MTDNGQTKLIPLNEAAPGIAKQIRVRSNLWGWAPAGIACPSCGDELHAPMFYVGVSEKSRALTCGNCTYHAEVFPTGEVRVHDEGGTIRPPQPEHPPPRQESGPDLRPWWRPW